MTSYHRYSCDSNARTRVGASQDYLKLGEARINRLGTMLVESNMQLEILASSLDSLNLTHTKSGVHHACSRLKLVWSLGREGPEVSWTLGRGWAALGSGSGWKTIRAVARCRGSPGGARSGFIPTQEGLRDLVQKTRAIGVLIAHPHHQASLSTCDVQA